MFDDEHIRFKKSISHHMNAFYVHIFIWCGLCETAEWNEKKNKTAYRTINHPSFSIHIWFRAVRFDLFIIRNSLNDVYRCNLHINYYYAPTTNRSEINCSIFINDQFHTSWVYVSSLAQLTHTHNYQTHRVLLSFFAHVSIRRWVLQKSIRTLRFSQRFECKFVPVAHINGKLTSYSVQDNIINFDCDRVLFSIRNQLLRSQKITFRVVLRCCCCVCVSNCMHRIDDYYVR